MCSIRYFCQTLIELEFSRQIFEISPNIKFYENPSGGSRIVPCGQTDMTKLIVGVAILQTRLKISVHDRGVPH